MTTNNINNIRVICSNVVEKDGKFLLVKEAKEAAKDLYSLPSGKLELDETIIDGAIREAKEETGLDVNPVNIIGIYQKPKSEKGNNYTTIIFESKIIGGKITTSKEHPEVKFFSYEEIVELERKGLLRSSNVLDSIKRYKKGIRIDLSNLIVH